MHGYGWRVVALKGGDIDSGITFALNAVKAKDRYDAFAGTLNACASGGGLPCQGKMLMAVAVPG